MTGGLLSLLFHFLGKTEVNHQKCAIQVILSKQRIWSLPPTNLASSDENGQNIIGRDQYHNKQPTP